MLETVPPIISPVPTGIVLVDVFAVVPTIISSSVTGKNNVGSYDGIMMMMVMIRTRS